MAKIRIEVDVDSDGVLRSIKWDGTSLNITPISEKPMEEWFSPIKGRCVWKGLYKEICDKMGEDNPDIVFEFQGPSEDKIKFDYFCKINGLGIDPLSPKDLFDNAIYNARKFEDRKDWCRALNEWKTAEKNTVDRSELANLQYIIAEYYSHHKEEIEEDDWSEITYDIHLAIDYYEKSAGNNHVLSEYRLYEIFYFGQGGIKQNIDKAMVWLKKAAEHDHQKAKEEYQDICDKEKKEKLICERLAVINDLNDNKNLVLAKDLWDGSKYVDSVRLLKEEADKGNPIAAYYIGIAYHEGKGVNKKDLKQAIEWYSIAMEHSVFPQLGACNKLIDIYENEINSMSFMKKAALVVLGIIIPGSNFITIPAALLAGKWFNDKNKDVTVNEMIIKLKERKKEIISYHNELGITLPVTERISEVWDNLKDRYLLGSDSNGSN